MTALLLLLLLFASLHSALSLMNAALQNAGRAPSRERSAEGGKGALDELAGSPRLHITISLAQILTRFALAAVLVLLLIAAPLNDETRLIAGLLCLVLGGCLTLILGELVPESLGIAYAESISRLAVPPMRLLMLLLAPLTALALLVSGWVSRRLGGQPLGSPVTEEEIMTLVHASHSGGIIEEDEKDMIYSVLQLGDSTARELMIPRIDIVALDIQNTIMEALAVFVESGFSRIPVYEESIDTVVGLLYAKDILTVLKKQDRLESQAMRDLIRPSYFVPETKRADVLLKELQAKNVHLALVVDEYGGTSGLITIEDLIEEIIGDIRDEYDFGEEEDYIEIGDGSYLIDASMDLDDLNSLLDCAIDTAAADTLAGYIYLELGRVPKVSETVATDILSMTIKSIDGHRIRKVLARKITQPPAQSTSPTPPAAVLPSDAEQSRAHSK